jgi:hypothetical protein
MRSHGDYFESDFKRQGMIDFWMSHGKKTISDVYAKMSPMWIRHTSRSPQQVFIDHGK